MSCDRRLSSVLHGLLHMAESAGPLTSAELAHSMQTHPVVVRRVLGHLRQRGFVRSEKGHGGGWSIACDLASLTLRDVYEALGSPRLFAIQNKNEAPTCLIEQAVNASLDGSMRQAEAMLLESMGSVSLEHVAMDFHRRFEELGLGPYDAARRGPAPTQSRPTGAPADRKEETHD